MLRNLRRQVRDAASGLLERSGLVGEPVLRLDEAMLESPGVARAVLEAIAASRRELPSVVDVLAGRLVAGASVLLTIDATSAALTEQLVPALEAVGGGAVRVFVDPARLGAAGGLTAGELGAALGYGLVAGLYVGEAATADAATLRECIARGCAQLVAASATRCDAAAVSGAGGSEILRGELRRAGVRVLYTGQSGLATPGDAVQRRVELGRDVEVEQLRTFLDLEPAAQAAWLGRARARRAAARVTRR